MTRIVSTCFLVEGVVNDADTRKALQALFEIFAEHALARAGDYRVIAG
ncbi:MAG: hypothetical protein L0K74_03315 [Acidipropionibacterium acidipropionici]|nr:hypothetical protein [Acidipropionibacterium acidipropionici]